MGHGRVLTGLLIAALAIAMTGPALAKQKQKPQPVTKTIQKKSAGRKCVTTAPPFMRNPRFMNRGFFKKKRYEKKNVRAEMS